MSNKALGQCRSFTVIYRYRIGYEPVGRGFESPAARQKHGTPNGVPCFFALKSARDSKGRKRKRSGGAFSARRADDRCFQKIHKLRGRGGRQAETPCSAPINRYGLLSVSVCFYVMKSVRTRYLLLPWNSFTSTPSKALSVSCAVVNWDL